MTGQDPQSRPPAPASPRGAPGYLEPDSSIAPWRRSLDSVGSRWIDWLAEALVRHWLFIVNTLVGLYAFLPLAAPVLLATGLTDPAAAIYQLYGYFCHQDASRSWYIFGHQIAFCQRDVAAYSTMFLAGLVFAYRRRSIRSLELRWFLLLIAPLAVDGLTQAVGLRESTALLRAVTGTLFGAAIVWLTYPYFQRAIED